MTEKFKASELTPSARETIREAVISQLEDSTNYSGLSDGDRKKLVQSIDKSIDTFSNLIGPDQPDKIAQAVIELIFGGINLKNKHKNSPEPARQIKEDTMLKRERIAPPKVVEQFAIDEKDIPNQLAEDSLAVVRLSLQILVNQLRGWALFGITKKKANSLGSDFLRETMAARRNIRDLSRKTEGLNFRNCELIKNYLRLEGKILDKITDLQIGSEDDIAVALTMLDLYCDDLATVNPPPLR